MDIHIMEKGTPISLAEKSPGLKKLFVGMGWDVNTQGGPDYDLDLTAVLLNAAGKVTDAKDILYYGNLQYKNAAGEVAIQHSADNLTGAGEGDDEWLEMTLAGLPAEVAKVAIIVNIYQAVQRNQNFGNVSSSFIRLVDGDTKAEFARHELKNEFASNSGVFVAEVYREGSDWKAKVVAEGVNGSIEEILKARGMM